MLEVPYLAPTLPDDRSGRFIATGIILMLVALMSGCATAMIPVSIVIQKQMAQQIAAQQASHASHSSAPSSHTAVPRNFGPPAVAPLVIGGVMYLAFTVATGWLAVAALLKRRYVRPLVIIFSTHGLIFGVMMVLAFAILLPMEWQEITAGNPGAAWPALIGIASVVGMTLLVMIGIPSVLLILMKPEAVRETAEHYDLRRRWTDGLPIKLLGLVLTLAVFGIFELSAIHNPSLPLIAWVVKGPIAILFFLGHSALMMVAAVLVYRRRVLGWHLALYGVVVPSVIICLSSLLLPSDQFLLMSDQNEQTLEMAQRNDASLRMLWAFFSGVTLIATVIYLRRMRPLIEPPMATLASE